MLNKSIRSRYFSISLKALCGMLLLVSYLVGNNQIKTLHNLLHDHADMVSHSAAEEKDPCHSTIYHSGEVEGCTHQAHIFGNEKCDLCNLICHVDQIITCNSSCKFINHLSVIRIDFISIELTGTTVNLPSRAPPLV